MDAAFWQQDSNGEQSLAYVELLAPLIKAVQELSAENAALTERVAALEQA